MVNAVLEKEFRVNFNSIYNSPLQINNYNWSISPNVSVIAETDSTIIYSFIESNVYTISYSLELINGESLCVLNDQKIIEIGVNSNMSIPEFICVGVTSLLR